MIFVLNHSDKNPLPFMLIYSNLQSSDEIVSYDQVFRPQYDFYPYITSDADGHLGKLKKKINVQLFVLFCQLVWIIALFLKKYTGETEF